MPATPTSPMPLTPAVFHILLALADAERHGYGIMQEIAANTDGQMQMGPGTLYGTLKRMLRDDLIEEAEARPNPAHDDERRRYYRLTDMGRRTLQRGSAAPRPADASHPAETAVGQGRN